MALFVTHRPSHNYHLRTYAKYGHRDPISDKTRGSGAQGRGSPLSSIAIDEKAHTPRDLIGFVNYKLTKPQNQHIILISFANHKLTKLHISKQSLDSLSLSLIKSLPLRTRGPSKQDRPHALRRFQQRTCTAVHKQQGTLMCLKNTL